MNYKSLLILAIFFLYGLICWNYYVCEIKGLCDSTTEVVSSNASYPIQFYKNSDNYRLNTFDNYADSIINLSHSKNIDIIGYYSDYETNKTSYPNLGIARANVLLNILKERGLDISCASILGLKKDIIFKDSIAISSHIDTSVSIDMNSSDVQLISHYGITEIYFPKNSSDELKSDALDSYLNNLTKDASKEKIKLIGHTDNTGAESVNIELSLKRSHSIKDRLIGLGFKEQNIICEGKGSSMPKVENNSESNRAINRRVELIIE